MKKTKAKAQKQEDIDTSMPVGMKIALGGVTLGLIFVLIFIAIYIINEWYKDHYLVFQSPIEVKLQSPVVVETVESEDKKSVRSKIINNIYADDEDTFSVDKTESVETVSLEASKGGLITAGEASFYTFEGCLGCHPERIMANGERLDDDKKTLALVPELFLKYKNETVRVVNVKTGMETLAVVTDSGGFGKYDRVADLSLATKNMIKCDDLCEVEIYQE